jgi:hypothetical protein
MEAVENPGASRFFNGDIDSLMIGKKLIFKLFVDKCTTTYKIDDLFSIPVSEESFRHKGIKRENKVCLNNPVIVNVPPNFEHVILDLSAKFAEIFHTNSTTYLLDTSANKLSLFPPNTSNEEKLKRGIDPEMRNFIGTVRLWVDQDHLERFGEIKSIIQTSSCKISCYEKCIIKEIIME